MEQKLYVFAQFLNLLSRYEFQRIVNKYNGDYRTKTFKCWHQMASMIFAHIRQEDSLRDVDAALNAHSSKLYHIGIQQCPKSTLADANEKRDYRIYEEFARSLMHHARRAYSNTALALDIDNAVYALDASTIDLTLSLFPWAKFRTTKGAVKLHAMIDLRGNVPAFAHITDGKVHDVKAAPLIQIEAEGIYLVDRAYIEFDWLWSINQSNAYFVTRLKRSIKWTRVISHPVDKSVGLRSDQEILLFSKDTKAKYPQRLRRVSFRDDVQDRTLIFLTNNFHLPADKIAALYKARWEIELFFKWIKQNLKVKSFLGTSPNAVKTQLWIAMIVYLILAIINRLGDLEKAFLIDDYAEGKDTGIIDLLLVGTIDQHHLNDLSRKTERYIKRKIRSLVLSREEFQNMVPSFEARPRVLIWEAKT
jgi:hypothetical protein